jgi:hypothetical protein
MSNKTKRILSIAKIQDVFIKYLEYSKVLTQNGGRKAFFPELVSENIVMKILKHINPDNEYEFSHKHGDIFDKTLNFYIEIKTFQTDFPILISNVQNTFKQIILVDARKMPEFSVYLINTNREDILVEINREYGKISNYNSKTSVNKDIFFNKNKELYKKLDLLFKGEIMDLSKDKFYDTEKIYDDDTQYFVDKLLDKKKVKGKVYYLVKWRNYSKTTWEPVDNIEPSLIVDFESL